MPAARRLAAAVRRGEYGRFDDPFGTLWRGRRAPSSLRRDGRPRPGSGPKRGLAVTATSELNE